jgi:hypothetical protein
MKFEFKFKLDQIFNYQLRIVSMTHPHLRSQIKGQRQKAFIRLTDEAGQTILEYANQKKQLPRGCHTEEDLFTKLTIDDLGRTQHVIIASTQNPCLHRDDNQIPCLDRILKMCQANPHLQVSILYSKPCWSDVRFLAKQGKSTLSYQVQLLNWIQDQMQQFGVTNLHINKVEK